MRLRVGIVGTGTSWQDRYRPALHALRDRFCVTAVYSPVGMLAERVAQELHTTASGGYQQLCRREDVDAVLVLSNGWLGHLPILAACDAGKAVYSDARLACDPDEAKGLKQRVDQSGVAFVAGFTRRHAPATVRLMELMATRLGQPRLLFCHHRAEREGPAPATKVGVSNGTQHLTDLVDWCCYIVGSSPSSVLGVSHSTSGAATRTEDYRMLSLDYSDSGMVGDGPVAQISHGNYLTSAWPEAGGFRPPAQLQVCCERGVAFIDLPATVVWFDEAGRHLENLGGERPLGEKLLMQFHRAVTSLVRKRDDLEAAFRASRIVATGDRSVREGRRLPC
jgi:predicted dehydrogenase